MVAEATQSTMSTAPAGDGQARANQIKHPHTSLITIRRSRMICSLSVNSLAFLVRFDCGNYLRNKHPPQPCDTFIARLKRDSSYWLNRNLGSYTDAEGVRSRQKVRKHPKARRRNGRKLPRQACCETLEVTTTCGTKRASVKPRPGRGVWCWIPATRLRPYSHIPGRPVP